MSRSDALPTVLEPVWRESNRCCIHFIFIYCKKYFLIIRSKVISKSPLVAVRIQNLTESIQTDRKSNWLQTRHKLWVLKTDFGIIREHRCILGCTCLESSKERPHYWLGSVLSVNRPIEVIGPQAQKYCCRSY